MNNSRLLNGQSAEPAGAGSMTVTASDLYDYLQCPHRLTMDLVGNPADRDVVSSFVELLWERGNAYENKFIRKLAQKEPILDLSSFSGDEREKRTLTALRDGVSLIYGGRLSAGDLQGIPDLLRREGRGYIPMDIKSGQGKEGGDDEIDGKPKRHYAAQLALYVDILERLGFSAARRGIILDINEKEVVYDLTQPRGPKISKSQWDEYEEVLRDASSVLDRTTTTLPACSAACKLCHWYSVCLKEIRVADDLTLIPRLGRTIRDEMIDEIPTVSALASIELEAYVRPRNKTAFRRVGAENLHTFHERAKLLSAPGSKPYLKAALNLPSAPTELFFDIETDPMQDICYLHGFVIRECGKINDERFVGFFADDATPGAERRAFELAIELFRKSQPSVVYCYSKYERTWLRKLQARHTDICSPEEIEELFDPRRSIDLYNDVVLRTTEWPTNDHSIKTLAKYVGFKWRDQNPSGAASIEWFKRWIETRDTTVKQRILEYNEDDCRATSALLDAIIHLGPHVAA